MRLFINKRCIFWVGLFILAYTPLTAQRYPYTTITNKDGLPQSSVFKTIQDHQGYIWMGTEAGLTRYDGYQFKNYSYFSGLNANFIFDVDFDAKGRLWCASFGTGIAVFNGHEFYSFNKTNGFPCDFVTDILFTSDNELWVTSKDNGVVRVTMDYTPHIYQHKETAKGFRGVKLDELPNGDIIAGGGQGVYKFRKDREFAPELLTRELCLALHADDEGGIWMGGAGTLFYIQGDSIIDKSNLLPFPVALLNISDPENNGTIYVSTESGLLIIKDNTTTWLTSANGLSYDLIKDVSTDDFGNLWVSTYGNGATILNDRGMTHYDKDGEGGDLCAFSIGEEKNGTIWIGKYFGGYFEITDTSFSRTDQPIPKDANPLMSLTDAEGNVYLNSGNTKIYKITNGEVVWQFTNPFPNRTIFGILKKDDGRLLVTGSFGCIWVNETTGEFDMIESTRDVFMKDPFGDEYGNIWLLGEQGEIYQLSGNGYKEYTEVLNPQHATITDGMYDPIRHVWWFTTASGVVIWNGKEQVRLHSGNVLKSDLCFSVIMDKVGNIWVGEVQGVDYIDLVNKKVTHLGYDEGFTPVETNARAVFNDSKGNIWFGTLTSATKINVDKIGRDSTKGILRLQEIEINGKVFYKENYNDTAYPEVKVKYNQNNFDFQFASLCYTNAKDVEYLWKMDGLDKNWITKVNTREVNYSNLSPGTYTFMVKAKNPNGYETNQINIKIVVAKPFWNTAGFYLFEALVFLFIVFLSFRFTRQSTNNRLGQIMTLLTIFIIFESIMLYLSGFIDKFTSGIPIFQLVMNVFLAASLHPLEQRIQRFMKQWAGKGK